MGLAASTMPHVKCYMQNKDFNVANVVQDWEAAARQLQAVQAQRGQDEEEAQISDDANDGLHGPGDNAQLDMAAAGGCWYQILTNLAVIECRVLPAAAGGC